MFLSLEKRQEPFQPPQQESEPQPAPSRARKPSEAPISARSWARKPSEELLQRIVPISNSENQPCKVCVCNDGTVRTLEGRLLRPSMDHKGHWKVTFHTHNGRRVELGVASLVLRGFPLLKDSGGSDLSVDLQKALRDLRPSQHG